MPTPRPSRFGGHQDARLVVGPPGLVASLWLIGVLASATEVSGAIQVGPALPDAAPPPAPVVERRCSARFAICVNGRGSTPPVEGSPPWCANVLAIAEDVWSALIETLRFAPPLTSRRSPDGARKFELDLVTDAPAPSARRAEVDLEHLALLEARDAWQTAVRLPRDLVIDGGCALRQEIAYAMAFASLVGTNGAEGRAVTEGFARHAAERIEPCPTLDLPRMAAAQASIAEPVTTTAAAEVFARTLDDRHGEGFLRIVPATFSLASDQALGAEPWVVRGGQPRLPNETSLFDVLTATQRDRGDDLVSLLMDAARVRLVDLATEPVWDFRVSASSLPRNLGVRRGIGPGGTTFIRVDLDRAVESLEIEIRWESEAPFRWSVVRLGSEPGRPRVVLGEVTAPLLERQRSLHLEVRHLEKANAAVLMGTWLPDPFDASLIEPPRHGYEAAFFAEP